MKISDHAPAPVVRPRGLQGVNGGLRLLKLREVARLLSVSVITVRRRIHEGALAHVRVADRLYVRPQDLDAFVARNFVPDR